MKTVWDEVCLQERMGEGPFWSAYEQEIDRIIAYYIEKLDEPAKQALWLQTSAGDDWECTLGSDNDQWSNAPALDNDIVGYIRSAVRKEAEKCENRRVERYLEDSYNARHELDMDANRSFSIVDP